MSFKREQIQLLTIIGSFLMFIALLMALLSFFIWIVGSIEKTTLMLISISIVGITGSLIFVRIIKKN